jgi:hypothetical protein
MGIVDRACEQGGKSNVDDTRKFVRKLPENQEKAERNYSRANGNESGKLPNKRKGTMK